MTLKVQWARLILFGALSVLPAKMQGQTNVGCVSATDTYAPIYRDGYGGMVSRTDQASVKTRSLFGLPTIADAQVTIVSDTTICRIASAAYDSVFSHSAAAEQPLVLKIGSAQYVVVKGLEKKGGRANVLFNQNFTVAEKKIWF
jgi:hypothetical protein